MADLHRDPNHPGNSPKHHTGNKCIESGCDRPAGTAWGPHWCYLHNAERIERIDNSLSKIAADFGANQ